MNSEILSRWLKAYGRAWETRDPVAVSALFAEDASYHELPFADPAIGHAGIRQYWESATRNQSSIVFSAEVVAVADNQGIAHWSAEFTREPSGVHTKLDGVFLLEFDTQGLCRKLREWWHRTELPSPRQQRQEI